jgi:hypothetical protein
MKFGIHSLLFHETFTGNDLPLLDEVKRMGFDAIELGRIRAIWKRAVRPI